MEGGSEPHGAEPDAKRRRVDGEDATGSSSAAGGAGAAPGGAHAPGGQWDTQQQQQQQAGPFSAAPQGVFAQQQHPQQQQQPWQEQQQPRPKEEQQQQQPEQPHPHLPQQQQQQQPPQPQRAAGGPPVASHLHLQVVTPAPAAPPASASYARSSGAYTQREEHLQRMEAAGEIRFAYVKNDGTPQNMIWLIGLKNVFSRQLPNMPKEYIARLVLNRHHRSVALVNRGGSVVGGITYRTFAPHTFGEIAFCAVTAAEQVKGFGTRLMNQTKAAARDHDGLTHFLTYADNNAVGYFLKQGFTRQIGLPRDVWGGYIKDYDGGTLMECVLHPRLPYGDLAGMLRTQKGALDARMRELSNAHVVRPPLPRSARPLPKEAAHPQQREVPVPVDIGSIPGVREAGWAPEHVPRPKYRILLDGAVEPVPVTPQAMAAVMEGALATLETHSDAWPFKRPVDPSEAVDYYDIIRDPVDLSLVRTRLAARSYYAGLDMFLADLRRMFTNCRYYNTPATPYFQCANRLEAALDAYMALHLAFDEDPARN